VLIENNFKEKLINYLNSQEIGSFSINEFNQKTGRKLKRINVLKRICCCKEVKELKSILNSFTNTEYVSICKSEQCVFFINNESNEEDIIAKLNESGYEASLHSEKGNKKDKEIDIKPINTPNDNQ
jgi:hypothetical protein